MDDPGREAAPPPYPEGPPPSSTPPPAAVTWQAPGTGPRSGWQPARTETRRRTFWLGCLAIVLGPILLGLVAFVVAFGQLRAIADFPGSTGGQITEVNVRTIDGSTRWELVAAPGLDEADGARLACHVIRPVFARLGMPDVEFYVLNRAGDVISSWETPCGDPGPIGPSA